MSLKTEVVLMVAHRVFGKLQEEGAVCLIHEGVANDLIQRGIAKLKNESTDTSDEGDSGE